MRLSLVVFAGLFFGSQHLLADAPTLVNAPISKIFLPLGFDDNDRVEVIVSGVFPDSCYKVGPADAIVDERTKSIVVNAFSYYYEGGQCLPLATPFFKVIELKSTLPKGEYKVVVKTGDVPLSEVLLIAESPRADADDFLYANVENAEILTPSSQTNTYDVVVKGRHPLPLRGCVLIDQVKFSVSSSDVLVVQPITKIVEGPQCADASPSGKFEYRVTVPFELTQEEVVLHTRVLNGGSLNSLVRLR
jgi:hypothetical protein